jgi:hypothetical protein
LAAQNSHKYSAYGNKTSSQYEYMAMVEQVEKLQFKLNQQNQDLGRNSSTDYIHNQDYGDHQRESLNRSLFSEEEKKINTGHFNSKADDTN